MLGFGFVLPKACANHPTTSSSPLAGTWTNSLGSVWTLNADGTFEVMRRHSSKPLPGTYTISNDTITIQGTPGTTPKGGDVPGVYRLCAAKVI